MEETLGKRIAAWRRRVGMTQDQLAERLGVTAQAVSKWENDQSCPDIATLPRLAEIFSVTTDQLLGVPQKEEVHTGEVVTEKDEDKHSLFEIDLSGSKKDALGLGIWVLLSGALLLLNNHFNQNGGIWESLMIAGLLTIGFMGIRRHFFISLACILFGTYEGLNNFYVLPDIGTMGIWAVFLMALGLSILVDALRKPKKRKIRITRDGNPITLNGTGFVEGNMELGEESFVCASNFNEKTYRVELPRVKNGSAQTSFSEMKLDLTGVQEFAPGCEIFLSCSFGDMEVTVPRNCKVNIQDKVSFGTVECKGKPDSDAPYSLTADCKVSFGEVTIVYV